MPQQSSSSIQNLNHMMDKLELLDNGHTNKILSNINKNISYIHKLAQSTSRVATKAEKSLKDACTILTPVLDVLENYQVTNTKEELSGYSAVYHIFSGAHVVLDDDGKVFETLKDKGQSRYSSHYLTAKKQEEMKRLCDKGDRDDLEKKAEKAVSEGKPDRDFRAEVIFNEWVLGVYKDEDGKIHTWFQFEGHAHQPRSFYACRLLELFDAILQKFAYSLEKLLHHVDFVKYCFHGKTKNIGQYGNSSFVETKAPDAEQENSAVTQGPLHLVPTPSSGRQL